MTSILPGLTGPLTTAGIAFADNENTDTGESPKDSGPPPPIKPSHKRTAAPHFLHR